MKILLLGSFEKGALENYFFQGLMSKTSVLDKFDITKNYYSRLSNSIFNKVINKARPSFFFKPINRSLLQVIGNRSYDVILVFKGLTLFPETIAQLKKNTNLLCCYNPDHPFKFYSEGSGNKNILDSIQLYDIYFSYARRISTDLATNYKVRSYTIPFGYDASPYNRNITLEKRFQNRWLFIGSYDSQRADFLNSLQDDDVDVYGDPKWSTRNRSRNASKGVHHGGPLYDDDYKNAICYARGVFNILRRQNLEEQSHNMRTFEVPGYGGLLIANRTDEQMSFFEDGKEAVYFDSIEELTDKLSFLRTHPAEVEKIKSAALQRSTNSQYSYMSRSLELYRILQNNI